MSHHHKPQRWDLMLGGSAALIAVGGIYASRAAGNTATFGFGVIDLHLQNSLFAVAISFLILVGIQAAIRFRGINTACRWSLERMLLRRHRSVDRSG